MSKISFHGKKIREWISQGLSNIEIYDKYYELVDQGLTISLEQFRKSVRNTRCKLHKKNKDKIVKEAYPEKSEIEKTKDKEGNNVTHINISNTRNKTLEYIVEKFNIDLNFFEVIKFKVRDATVHTNYRDQNLTWEDGKMSGHSIRKPEFILKDLYHVTAIFREKKQVVIVDKIIKDQINDMQQYAPDYSQAPYIILKPDAPFIFEIPPYDIHFGLLCWHEQTGQNYDIKIAPKMLIKGVGYHLGNTKGYNLCEIVMPIGSDFFNVDNEFLTTGRSSKVQDEDCREAKTFRTARETLVEVIDMCSQVAPVRVLIVPGNHEMSRLFHLGDALYCWYRNNKNVTVDNAPTTRKYYKWGYNLRGYTHGSEEKINRLRALIVEENGANYTNSKYREFLTGHLHNEIVKDVNGVIFRTLPSFVVPAEYVKRKGYFSVRNFQTFLIHKTRGPHAQFNWYDM